MGRKHLSAALSQAVGRTHGNMSLHAGEAKSYTKT